MMSNLTASQPPNLAFLYGPSGSGKTKLGQALASRLNLPFIDLDEEIESQAGQSIPEIFAAEGESGFRGREKQALQRVLTHPRGIVALGGGALLDPESRALVEASGRVLYLTASPEILLERLCADEGARPLLAGAVAVRLGALLSRRAEHYASFPLQLDTGGYSLEEAAWEAQSLLGMFHVRGMGPGYAVRIRAGSLDGVGSAFQEAGLAGPGGLVTDENVGALYAERGADTLQKAGYAVHLFTIPAGERYKTITTVSRLWNAFLEAGLERGSTILALGGGVVSDLAGFAAATYLRGVAWGIVPTTLLAMVDASLGGKTGFNLPQGKNLIGAFYPPRLVLADPEILSTLPEAELRSGLAEVVKHGVIADPPLFELCTSRQAALESKTTLVSRAMAVKIRIIEADPFEEGRRAALNLGHTIGHAVEAASGFRLRHGEAVAIGMAAEARLAVQIGLANPDLPDHIATCLANLGLPTEIPPDLDRRDILRRMAVDKKKKQGAVQFSLPVQIGEVQTGVAIKMDLLEKAIGHSK